MNAELPPANMHTPGAKAIYFDIDRDYHYESAIHWQKAVDELVNMFPTLGREVVENTLRVNLVRT